MNAVRSHVLTLSREEMRARALGFAKRWAGPRREEADSKSFLDEFFQVFGRDRHAVEAIHEYRIERPERGEGRIDLLWPGKLLIEMKSSGKDLSPEKGGAARQAFDYLEHLDPEEMPRWILVSNFGHFALYDLGEEVHEFLKGLAPKRKPPQLVASFALEQLPDKLRHFAFIRDEEQQLFQTQPEVNQKAVKLLGFFHDSLKKTGYTGHALERLLVRVLFCLFAEDTDIFAWNSFTRLVERSKKDGTDLGQRLGRLFQTLDTPEPSRSPSLPSDFTPFPYVNGGLFKERLDLADTTAEDRAALVACCRFDWSRISPGIFGSLFQGVMEPAERREKGAHYTSEENILRVINPLFMDDLRAEFAQISASSVSRQKKLEAFQIRLSKLRFLDPACGCGNFLVVAYRELRALELEVIKLRFAWGDKTQTTIEFDPTAYIMLNVDQFYGIELEEFPALTAETAMWLTDHQVNMTFSKTFGRLYTRIPLLKSAKIVTGNALRTDWEDVLPSKECSYVLGNPPFIGKQYMTSQQNADMESVCGKIKGFGVLDFVTAWYVKAAAYIQGTRIGCAFVSTNSISQGEQPTVLWSHLFRQKIKIHFAHRTFAWENEASGKARVHVVIIGFGAFDRSHKLLYDYGAANGEVAVERGMPNISPYLMAGGDTVITARTKPLCDAPEIVFGNMPNDGGNLLLSQVDKEALLAQEPGAAAFIRPLLGAEEFINAIPRWCLWLVDAQPKDLAMLPLVLARIEAVAVSRRQSSRAATRALAKAPALFGEIRQPSGRYLAIPSISSERRRYIPMAFLPPSVIGNNKLLFVPDATDYHFGVLMSAMHMAWTNVVTGRLESRFQYSNKIVYNNFPWPTPEGNLSAAVEEAARAVLDARAPYLEAGSNLAVLYDPRIMPNGLLKAHQTLDRAVDRCYRPEPFRDDRERVEFLFARYEKLTSPLLPVAKPKRPRKTKAE